MGPSGDPHENHRIALLGCPAVGDYRLPAPHTWVHNHICLVSMSPLDGSQTLAEHGGLRVQAHSCGTEGPPSGQLCLKNSQSAWPKHSQN